MHAKLSNSREKYDKSIEMPPKIDESLKVLMENDA